MSLIQQGRILEGKEAKGMYEEKVERGTQQK